MRYVPKYHVLAHFTGIQLDYAIMRVSVCAQMQIVYGYARIQKDLPESVQLCNVFIR